MAAVQHDVYILNYLPLYLVMLLTLLAAALLLGPEGDLTPEEVAATRKCGFIPVDLGPRVLRADTAPIALVTMAQHVLGDMG